MIRYGWICPKCDRCITPDSTYCVECDAKTKGQAERQFTAPIDVSKYTNGLKQPVNLERFGPQHIDPIERPYPGTPYADR